MKYHIETYGCQMNKAESAALEAVLAERRWVEAEGPETADLVLINTCSVRITAENRAWGRVAHFAAMKRQRPFSLVVCGCMAERLKDSIQAEAPAVDYVLGNFQKPAFASVLEAVERSEAPGAVEEAPSFVFAPSHREPGAFSSFLPIMHGCDNFCSYCIVPYVRGREVSRDPRDVLAEIREAGAAGVREITLLGQNVNSYRWSGDGQALDFAGLLRAAGRAASEAGVGRVRFLSSHPKDLSDSTIDALASEPALAKHVHLCVQHGSDRVLSAMNRGYTSDYYRGLAAKIRARVAGATLSTDILVGFPGETEDDVEATLRLMEELRFAYAYMYYYNRREGTAAASMGGQLPTDVKKARLARVIELQKSITKSVMRGMVGSEAVALVEGVSKRSACEVVARTGEDFMAVFKAPPSSVGSFVRLELSGVRGTTFSARIAG